jgi:hypothetical protein
LTVVSNSKVINSPHSYFVFKLLELLKEKREARREEERREAMLCCAGGS